MVHKFILIFSMRVSTVYFREEEEDQVPVQERPLLLDQE